MCHLVVEHMVLQVMHLAFVVHYVSFVEENLTVPKEPVSEGKHGQWSVLKDFEDLNV